MQKLKQTILLCLLCTIGIATHAEDIPNNEIWYEATSKLSEVTDEWSSGIHMNAFGASITSHTFSDGKGIIRFEGDVTSIGSSAFYSCSCLTSITIPGSVTSIGRYAFDGCSGLTSVTIPNSVTEIGDDSFSSCSGLTSVTIPNSVTSIGSYAFSGCSGLTSVTIPNSVTEIGFGVFNECSSLTSVTIPNSVTKIESGAFASCNSLTSVTIPNSVTSIGEWAFSYHNLTYITVEGTTPPSIEQNTFIDFEKPTLYVPASALEAYKSHAQWGLFKNIQAIQSETPQVGTKFEVNGVAYSILSIGDKNEVEVISKTPAYSGSVTIPAQVTYQDAKYNVVQIGYCAFQNCKIEAMTLPYTIRKLDKAAFGGCSMPKLTVLANTPPELYCDFDSQQYDNLEVVVNDNALLSYMNDQYWGKFKNLHGTTVYSADEAWKKLSAKATELEAHIKDIEDYAKFYHYLEGYMLQSATAQQRLRIQLIGKAVDECANEINQTKLNLQEYMQGVQKDIYAASSANQLTLIVVEAEGYLDKVRQDLSGYDAQIADVISGFKSAYAELIISIAQTAVNSMANDIANITVECGVLRDQYNALKAQCGTSVGMIDPVILEDPVVMKYEKDLYATIEDLEASSENYAKLVSGTLPTSVDDVFTLARKMYDLERDIENTKKRCEDLYDRYDEVEKIVKSGKLVEDTTDHSWRVSNRTDITVDFASIEEADKSDLVVDGDTLYLERGTRLENQTFKKRLVIVGPGYKYDKTGQDALVKSLYAYGEGATVIGLEIGELFADANNLTISHCHLYDVIGNKTSYQNENCKIHSCFIGGCIQGDGDNTDAWTLTNNIFAEGFIRDLDNAVLDHNTFVVSNADWCLRNVTNSEVKNNILFHKRVNPLMDCNDNTYTKNIFSMDLKLDNNKSNVTLEKIIACTGDPSQEAYYQTYKGLDTYQYSTDGSDCGAFGGAFGGASPYLMHGYTDLYVESEEGGGDVDPGFLIEPNDMLALKSLYNCYGGSNWNVKWTFKDANVEAEDFPGVKFTTDVDTYGYHYVQEINLSENNLSGDVSNWTLRLPQLTSLNLSRNNLCGDLTGFVAELGNMKTLDVSYNMLTGLTSLPESVKTLYKGYQMSGKYKSDYYASLEPVRVMISDEGVKTTLPSILTYNLSKNSCVPTTTELLANPSDKSRFGDVVPVSGGYKTTWMTTPYIYKYAQDVTICMRSEDGCLYPAILSYADGDADMSGRTNLLDVQNTINYILNPALLERFNFSAANTYSDEQVNVQDVVCTVNIVLGLPNSPLARKRMSGYDLNSTSNALYTQEEKLWLSTDTETAALDISLQGVSTDEVALMLNRNDFQMLARNTEDGSRYVVYSLTGKTIPVGTTAILRLANDDAMPADALLSTIDAKSIPVSLTTHPTDIADIHAGNSAVRIYSVSGTEVYNSPGTISASDLARVLNGLQNGIYVVVQQMDGGTHKKYKYLKK